MKIVINACYGGFSLSDEAFELYLKKKGVKYYKYPDKLEFLGNHYYAMPKEEYDELEKKSLKEKGDYSDVNGKGYYLNDRDIERDDKILVEVVKELKEKANGRCAKLKVVNVPDGVDWEIDEYDGWEQVEEKHRSWD